MRKKNDSPNKYASFVNILKKKNPYCLGCFRQKLITFFKKIYRNFFYSGKVLVADKGWLLTGKLETRDQPPVITDNSVIKRL